jgi:antigen flippase
MIYCAADQTVSSSNSKSSGYSQILRASSILGGAQVVSYVIAIARTKIVAVLLGPGGIGLLSLFQSLTAAVATVATLGINSSGVREIAEAESSGDRERVAKCARVIARVSWINGILSALIVTSLSWPLSHWILGSSSYAATIAILATSLVFTLPGGAEAARLEGLRRIGDIARIQIYSMMSSTLVAIGLYAWLQERGIVPVLIVSAMINFGFSKWYASKVALPPTTLTITETWFHAKKMIGLGLAFMWSAVMSASIPFVIRLLVVRESGIDANGIYQSAWAMSGMFAGFILSAMGTDFYPRLAATTSDVSKMNQMVNEQAQVGILLSMPGLLGTMIFAPTLMKLLYSSEFMPAATLLPWFVMGVFFKIVAWPMGFILIAKGEARWFAISETAFNVALFGLSVLLLRLFDLPGISYAFATAYLLYVLLLLRLTKNISGHSWTTATICSLALACLFIAAGLLIFEYFSGWIQIISGGLLVSASIFVTFRGVILRLGSEHRLSAMISRVPGMKALLGIRTL